jgi:hypothetical protein
LNAYRIDRLVEILKPYAKNVEEPKEFSLDVNNMWKWLVEQICCRASSKFIDLLEKRGDKENFHSQLSLNKMPLSYEEILGVLTQFKATRLRPSASKTIIEIYRRSFHNGEFKLISLFKEELPSKELTNKRIEAERRFRNTLIKEHAFVWVLLRNEWRIYDWKKKPVSDWLKDIGFAVTLMPFDTNVKKILKELGIRLTDENYEEVEDVFIRKVCPKLQILPSQVDKIFYRNSNQIVELLKS